DREALLVVGEELRRQGAAALSVVLDEHVVLVLAAVRLADDGGELPDVVFQGQARGLGVDEGDAGHDSSSGGQVSGSVSWSVSHGSSGGGSSGGGGGAAVGVGVGVAAGAGVAADVAGLGVTVTLRGASGRRGRRGLRCVGVAATCGAAGGDVAGGDTGVVSGVASGVAGGGAGATRGVPSGHAMAASRPPDAARAATVT